MNTGKWTSIKFTLFCFSTKSSLDHLLWDFNIRFELLKDLCLRRTQRTSWSGAASNAHQCRRTCFYYTASFTYPNSTHYHTQKQNFTPSSSSSQKSNTQLKDRAGPASRQQLANIWQRRCCQLSPPSTRDYVSVNWSVLSHQNNEINGWITLATDDWYRWQVHHSMPLFPCLTGVSSPPL